MSCRECLLTKDIGNVGLVLCWEGKFWSLLLIMDILQLSLGPQHMHRQRTASTSAWVSAVWGSPTGMPHQEDDSLLEQIFYRVLHHHYRIDVQNISLKWTPTTVNVQVTKNEGNF